MTDRINEILAPGRAAVITGAANGIGAGIAHALAAKGMKLALLDTDEKALAGLAKSLKTETLLVCGDVAEPSTASQLREQTMARFGDVALMVNNAAIKRQGGPWDAPEQWQQQMDVNVSSVLRMHHLFVPDMIASTRPSAIVNLGSKDGITTPPGYAAYSVTKAAVKVLTEQLSHELVKSTDGHVSAHLLVPGYVWTPMNMALKPEGTSKPDGAWTVEQLVRHFLAGLANEDFYIICPDNEVSSELDMKRIRWGAEDMVFNRPALSRWHPDWKEKAAEWMHRN